MFTGMLEFAPQPLTSNSADSTFPLRARSHCEHVPTASEHIPSASMFPLQASSLC